MGDFFFYVCALEDRVLYPRSMAYRRANLGLRADGSLHRRLLDIEMTKQATIRFSLLGLLHS